VSKLVEWSDELSVGIQEFDEQHKVLVALLNQLTTALHGHGGSAAARPILNQLADYALVHFAIEESLMRVLNYPEYEPHKHEHEALMAQLKDLQSKLDTDGQASLEARLTRHILRSDKRYALHFLDRGLAPSWENKSWVDRLWNARANQQLPQPSAGS
jgi:hemerythrin